MTQTYPIAWSHSRVKSYLECPKRFHHETILKDVKYEQGAPQVEGERVHLALKRRLTQRIPLSGPDAKYEPLIAALEKLPGTNMGERDYALNAQLRPTGYFDPDCWVRVTIDFVNLNGPRGILLDWKNGKVTVDEDQLKLYAAVGFIFYPQVEEFDTRYVFLQHGVNPGRKYVRSELGQMWKDLIVVPRAIQSAVDRNDWPADPGRKCGYCSVNKARKCLEADGPYRGQ